MSVSARTGLVVYRNTGGVDAIDEYSRRLVDALVGHGTPTEYVACGLSSARCRSGDPPWILLQYNPFSYGRWGIAPGLVRDAALLRYRTGASLAVCVHEPWTHVHDWRSALMATYHRAQLPALLHQADVVLGVTETLVQHLGSGAVHVPVGSNLTPIALSARTARAHLDIADEFVVALFGRGHPSRSLDHAEAAIVALASSRDARTIRVLSLGSGAPPLNVPPGVTVDTPGRLEPEELSLRLRASDIMLLPFRDGISTRRTTLMAALAHGLPVAGLHGPGTDSVLIHNPEGLLLTPAGRPAAYARAVVELAADPVRLHNTGIAGRILYEQNFDWPVLARRVTAALRHAGIAP